MERIKTDYLDRRRGRNRCSFSSRGSRRKKTGGGKATTTTTLDDLSYQVGPNTVDVEDKDLPRPLSQQHVEPLSSNDCVGSVDTRRRETLYKCTGEGEKKNARERERKESVDIDQWELRIRARAFPLAASVLGGGRRKKIDDDAEIYHYARLCTDSDGEIK